MSTITTATVASVTGATSTRSITRTINPDNANELIISYGNVGIVIDKQAWTMLSINAPVKAFTAIQQ